jgi:hypothetical protein
MVDLVTAALLILVVGLAMFYAGALPIPVGYEGGKVKWVKWCGTGMHAHIVYWYEDSGFQTIHPEDRNDA